jgi:peptidoglycan LD-endopeptidase LytH
MQAAFNNIIKNYKGIIKPIVDISEHATLFPIKLDKDTYNIPEHLLSCNEDLETWLLNYCKENQYAFAIGGYNEHRTAYTKSNLFTKDEEPRLLHIGLDIFNTVGTPVYLPINGIVHSYANNNTFGDYGPTLIMQHNIDGFIFHTLYGHNSIADMAIWQQFIPNQTIKAGTLIGHMGHVSENKGWAAHVHFQIIIDMEGKEGDYYGVCKFSERERYLRNCPNPDYILNLNTYIS